jgi:SH3-like domain-containing protein
MKYVGAVVAFLCNAIGSRQAVSAACTILLALQGTGTALAALEFLSIKDAAVIMYDAPSLKADKLYVATRSLPVEAVVKVEGWVKVRDSSGSLAWVEEKQLSEKRYVIVTVPSAEIHQAASSASPLVFRAHQNVVLELLEPAASGWARVKHPDGQAGYVRTTQVWGS